MAVQAQYPSNVLFFDRNVGEVKEMGYNQMEAQPSGYNLDPSSFLFANGAREIGGNSRKRGREANHNTSLSPINLFSLQQPAPPPAIVSLAQLHHHPPPATATCIVSTGLGLSLQDQRPQMSPSLSFLGGDLAAQIKQSNEEIDRFVQAQGEQLLRAVAERRGRQYRAAAAKLEEAVRRKEAEVAAAARRRAELEERVGRMEAEVETWEARARAQEAAAEALRAELRRAAAAAAERVAGGEQAAAADSESAYVDPDRVEVVVTKTTLGPACRACRRGYVSVVFVPCRHLCVCAECDSVVSTCPICRVPRSGSIHVLI